MFRLIEDLRVIRAKDPAARGTAEILLCYPGLHALWFHRLSHALWRAGVPLLPRLLSHLARFLTGVEIHPGARIGRRVFIDHGMGVVIGETARVGDDCLIYQGVTLGGTSLSPGKRHPTLEEHVVVGSGAKVLGNITLGHHTRVGSGSVVIKSAPAGSTIVGIPGRALDEHDDPGRPGRELEHAHLPDLDARAITALREQLQALQLQVAELRHRPLETLVPGPGSEDVESAFRAMRESAGPDRGAPEAADGGGI